MNFTWGKTGIGTLDNLGLQMQKVVRTMNQNRIETRFRYIDAEKRFLKHVAEKFNLQKIQNVKDIHLKSFVQEMQSKGLSSQYIKTELSAVRFFHNQTPGTRYELMDAKELNKEMNIGTTGDGRADRAWSEKEIDKFKELANTVNKPEYANLIEGIRSLGFRLDEACTLKYSQASQALKTNQLTFSNTKGGKERTLELNDRSRAILSKAIEGKTYKDYVFTPREFVENHKIHSFESQFQMFLVNNRGQIQDTDRQLTAHNLDISSKGALTAHGLRHSFARNEYNQKINSGLSAYNARKEVAEALGHHRDSITRIYISGGE